MPVYPLVEKQNGVCTYSPINIYGAYIYSNPYHNYTLGGIQHMDGRGGVARCNLDGSVHLGCCSAPYQQRQFETETFHLLGDMNHLVQRWGDESGKTNDICG